MIDETGTPNPATPNDAAQATSAEGERTGFCQDCGRPLTQETMRQVGSGVFCDPCLQRRAGTGPGTSAGYGAGGYVPPHTPSPALAGWLGIIPGVGAMYNGQFAKGIVHLLVFAVLSSLADHGNSIFGIFCFGWICYQSFEAYHTAKARLLGLPLPNPFGLNDIGERLGFGKGWQAGGPAQASPQSAWTPGATPPPPPTTAWATGPATPAEATSSRSDWVGYVPPTAFGAAAPPPVIPTAESWGSTPYQANYPPPPPIPPMPPFVYPAPPVANYGVNASPVEALSTRKRFPVGALWLIALGCLFLAINVGAHFELRGSWLVAVILAGVATWSLTHNMDQFRGLREAPGRTRHIVTVLRFPVILLVLAVLFALQGANWFTLGQTWPVLLLAFGGMLLFERSLSNADELPLAAPFTAAPASAPEAVDLNDTPKGGE